MKKLTFILLILLNLLIYGADTFILYYEKTI